MIIEQGYMKDPDFLIDLRDQFSAEEKNDAFMSVEKTIHELPLKLDKKSSSQKDYVGLARAAMAKGDYVTAKQEF